MKNSLLYLILFLFPIIQYANCTFNLPSQTIYGCFAEDIINYSSFPYSTSEVEISVANFIAETGGPSGDCTLSKVFYFDEISGSCPIIVERNFRILDVEDNEYFATQIFQIDPEFISLTLAPDVSINGCDTSDINILSNLGISETQKAITINELFNEGVSLTGGCLLYIYYQDVINEITDHYWDIYRTFQVMDDCGNLTETTQFISIIDLLPPVVYPLDTIFNVVNIADHPILSSFEFIQFYGLSDNCADESQFIFTFFERTDENICPTQIKRSYTIQDVNYNAITVEQILVFNPNTTEEIFIATCDPYVSPSGKYTWTQGGTYFDTIPNAGCGDSLLTIHIIKGEEVNIIGAGGHSYSSLFYCLANTNVVKVKSIDTLKVKGPLFIENDITFFSDDNVVFEIDCAEVSPHLNNFVHIAPNTTLTLSGVSFHFKNYSGGSLPLFNEGVLNIQNDCTFSGD